MVGMITSSPELERTVKEAGKTSLFFHSGLDCTILSMRWSIWWPTLNWVAWQFVGAFPICTQIKAAHQIKAHHPGLCHLSPSVGRKHWSPHRCGQVLQGSRLRRLLIVQKESMAHPRTYCQTTGPSSSHGFGRPSLNPWGHLSV